MTATAAGRPTVTPVPFDPEVQAVLDEIAKDPQPPLTRDAARGRRPDVPRQRHRHRRP